MRPTTHKTQRCGGPVIILLSCLMATASAASAQVNVLTANGDNFRLNANLHETQLSPGRVAPNSFGKVASFPVDGQVYAQVLYLSGVKIPGKGTHNVVYVATMQNTVFAFDADATSPVQLLWQANVGPAVPSEIIYTRGHPDISPALGILGTPAIDATAGVIYVVAETLVSGAPAFYMHALDVASGAEKANSPVLISATVQNPTGGDPIVFDPSQHLQRPGLLLVNNQATVAFGSHADSEPYHGWVFTYDTTNLQHQISAFASSTSGEGAAIWQSGRGLAADEAGNIFAITGNGDYDGASSFGESFLKLSGGTVADWYTPVNWESLVEIDADLSAGPALLPGSDTVIGADKAGTVYAINGKSMGQLGGAGSTGSTAQMVSAAQGNIFNLAVWNRPGQALLYVQGANQAPQAFAVTGGVVNSLPQSSGSVVPGGLGRVGMTLSANGTADGTGILWLTGGNYQSATLPGTLYAFDASNLANELWDSGMNPDRDNPGAFVKFTNPTVANGKVYVASTSNSVTVYGLLSQNPAALPLVTAIVNAASNQTGAIAPGEVVTLFGANLGPVAGAAMTIGLDGLAASYLGGAEVWFDGTPAPLLYAGSNQINAVVPFGLTNSSVRVQVAYQGRLSDAFVVSLASAQPGVFSISGTGSGQGQILNADGTPNSSQNPASPGSSVVVFVTGVGQTSPQGLDGALSSSSNPPTPLLPVTALVGGQPASVLSATGVPGAIYGLTQLRLAIPPQVATGANVSVVVNVGGRSSQPGLYLAVNGN